MEEGSVANIGEYFRQHLATPDKILYRYGEGDVWRDVTVAEIAALVARWQAALKGLGLAEGDRVAVCLKNGVNWIAVDLAALGLGLVVVPLYVEDNPDNAAWCADNAEAKVLVAESTRTAKALRDSKCPIPPIYVLRADPVDEAASVERLLPQSGSAPEFRDLATDALAT